MSIPPNCQVIVSQDLRIFHRLVSSEFTKCSGAILVMTFLQETCYLYYLTFCYTTIFAFVNSQSSKIIYFAIALV